MAVVGVRVELIATQRAYFALQSDSVTMRLIETGAAHLSLEARLSVAGPRTDWQSSLCEFHVALEIRVGVQIAVEMQSRA